MNLSDEDRAALRATDPVLVEAVARKMAEIDQRNPDAHPTSEYTGNGPFPDIAWPDDHKIWMTYAWKARHIVLLISRHAN
jgi:hypothetical protein